MFYNIYNGFHVAEFNKCFQQMAAAAEVATITVIIHPRATVTAVVFWCTNIAHYYPSIILLVVVLYSVPLLSCMLALFGCPLMSV